MILSYRGISHRSFNAETIEIAPSMKDALEKLGTGRALTAAETTAVFESFLDGASRPASDDELREYLIATSKRLPEPQELAGAARALRAAMKRVDFTLGASSGKLVDTCGTGGSGLDTFNTSTAAAFVAVAAGLTVAKHGNRSISSRCGSADVLEALGVRVDLDPSGAAGSLAETGFAFLFAPNFHPATRRAQVARRELGIRTIFNFLGPLCNPAGVECQVLGVSDRNMVTVMAEALRELGSEHSIVVCGEDGLDEATVSGSTKAAELRTGALRSYVITPEEFGFERREHDEIAGAAPPEAAVMVREVLSGAPGARSELTALNAGAALYVGGVSASWKEGVTKAQEILRSGAALEALQRVIAYRGAA